MNQPTNILEVPNFITARTPKGLRDAMIMHNLKMGAKYLYFDIQFSNGRWFAWYFDNNVLSVGDIQESSKGEK